MKKTSQQIKKLLVMHAVSPGWLSSWNMLNWARMALLQLSSSAQPQHLHFPARLLPQP